MGLESKYLWSQALGGELADPVEWVSNHWICHVLPGGYSTAGIAPGGGATGGSLAIRVEHRGLECPPPELHTLTSWASAPGDRMTGAGKVILQHKFCAFFLFFPLFPPFVVWDIFFVFVFLSRPLSFGTV